jgi:hypothetical protein
MKTMYKLTTIVGLLKRVRRKPGLAAFAMAALLFLSAMPAPARAQGTSTNTYGGSTVIHAGTIGLMPGQRVSITVPNFYFQDGSVRFVKHSIKVSSIESNLTYSGESGGLNESGHIFTIRYGDLSVAGEPVTGRVQVWIVIQSLQPSSTQERVEDSSADMLPPTFELIDNESGKTTVHGTLLKVWQGSLGLADWWASAPLRP